MRLRRSLQQAAPVVEAGAVTGHSQLFSSGFHSSWQPRWGAAGGDQEQLARLVPVGTHLFPVQLHHAAVAAGQGLQLRAAGGEKLAREAFYRLLAVLQQVGPAAGSLKRRARKRPRPGLSRPVIRALMSMAAAMEEVIPHF